MFGGDFLGQDALWVGKLLELDKVIEVCLHGVGRHCSFQLEVVFKVADSRLPIHCYVPEQKDKRGMGKLR